MAEEVQIPGSAAHAKIRSPWAAALLPIVTIGIYYFVWYYLGDSPGKSLLAVTLGALVIVPALISVYHTAQRIQAAQRLHGIQPLNGWLALVMYLLIVPVFWAYEQSELNKVWNGARAI